MCCNFIFKTPTKQTISYIIILHVAPRQPPALSHHLVDGVIELYRYEHEREAHYHQQRRHQAVNAEYFTAKQQVHHYNVGLFNVCLGNLHNLNFSSAKPS